MVGSVHRERALQRTVDSGRASQKAREGVTYIFDAINIMYSYFDRSKGKERLRRGKLLPRVWTCKQQ